MIPVKAFMPLLFIINFLNKICHSVRQLVSTPVFFASSSLHCYLFKVALKSIFNTHVYCFYFVFYFSLFWIRITVLNFFFNEIWYFSLESFKDFNAVVVIVYFSIQNFIFFLFQCKEKRWRQTNNLNSWTLTM